MHQIKSVAVYCGSAEHVNPRYYDATAELGQILAEEGIRLIYGGGGIGLMGALANASLKSGGEVIGISTELLYALEGLRIGQPKLSELHIVSTMHERKCMMFDRSDGFIILPGGLGTLEEAFEVLTWRQLGLHFKPIVFLNTSNYWDPLLNHLLSHMINEGFVRSIDRQLFRFCNHPVDILRALRK